MRARGLPFSPVEEFRAVPGKGVVGRVDGRSVALGNQALLADVGVACTEAVRMLREREIRIVMLTGDRKNKAEEVARTLGIEEVHAEVWPDQKLAMVKSLQAEGRRVAMAGDGINDAPALAQADVGIAMGTGADIAIQSAGVTLVRGDLRAVVKAFRFGKATMRNIRQNLFFAFIYNGLGIPLAAGVLYPFFGCCSAP